MQTSRLYSRCYAARHFPCRSFSKQTAARAIGSSNSMTGFYTSRGHGRRNSFSVRDSRQLLVPMEGRCHFFSSGSGGDRKPPRQISRDRRNLFANNSEKENFAKKFLEPAAKGELGHKRKIPKLAGKPPKANLAFDSAKDGRRWSPSEDDLESLGSPEQQELAQNLTNTDLRSPEVQKLQRDQVQTKDNQPIFDYKAFKEGKLPEFLERGKHDPYFALDELWNDKKYFWNEEDHDDYIPKDLDPSKIFDENGQCEVEWTDEDLKEKPHNWIEDDIDPRKYFGIPDDFDIEAALAGTLDVEKYEREREAKVLAAQGGGSGPKIDRDNDGKPNFRSQFEQDEYLGDQKKEEVVDPDTRYFKTSIDYIELAKRPLEDFPDDDDPEVLEYIKNRQQIWLLQDHIGGGTREDYIQALNEHPTDFARVSYIPLHPNERREPLPIFLPDFALVKQPSLDFVEAHVRYLYVTGLPPLTVNGEVGHISNPVHRSSLEQQVARLLDVDSTQVSAANSTSAFVGFHSPRELANAIKEGPLERTLVHKPIARKYDGSLSSETNDSLSSFVNTAPSGDGIIILTNMPLDCSIESLADELLPKGTELRQKYGEIFPGDVLIHSEGTALIRFSSSETAESLLCSSLFEARLEEMGVYTVHYLRARRELLHAGFDWMDKQEELRKYGNRLVIDGLHTPSKSFWLSHACAVYVRDLDPTITKEDLTKIFQKYSSRVRFDSSIEFVHCELSDEPILGAAYVGFEQNHEARACREALAGEGVDMTSNEEPARMKIGNRVASIFGMSDREVPGIKITPEVRTTRPIEELEDEMNNWQQYVDPADIEWLDKHGTPRVVIDETLRGIRRRNPVFGAYDSGFRDEQLEDGKERGQLYRELVVEYIELLKKCTATREDPGDAFWDDVFPGEEPDYSVFDEWDKQKAEIDAIYLKYSNN